ALRDVRRPDFRIYTGNDLGINMIEYGSDYLLGLATFAPRKFAERDRLWETADPAYYSLSDALQHLGNVAFRRPVPAYKHSAAVFLHSTGRIPSDLTHPRNPRRQCGRRKFSEIAPSVSVIEQHAIPALTIASGTATANFFSTLDDRNPTTQAKSKPLAVSAVWHKYQKVNLRQRGRYSGLPY